MLTSYKPQTTFTPGGPIQAEGPAIDTRQANVVLVKQETLTITKVSLATSTATLRRYKMTTTPIPM